MKRSSTSLTSEIGTNNESEIRANDESETRANDKPIIGLIFGRNTTRDGDNVITVVMKAMLDAEMMNGVVHYLPQFEGSAIDGFVEFFAKEYNVPFVRHTPKVQDFKNDIRAARRFCIDAILSKSLKTYAVTIRDDPICSLTKIAKDETLKYVIELFHVRTPEEVDEYLRVNNYPHVRHVDLYQYLEKRTKEILD